MRALLLAGAALTVFPFAAHAQTCPVPAAAAAAGYTTQTLGGTIGDNFAPVSPSGTGTTLNADGSVTIGGATNNADNAQLETAAAFGGGGYYQATMQTSGTVTAQGGWPAFWAVDQSNQSDHRIEVDIAEIYGATYGSAMHDWTGPDGASTAINTGVPQVTADFSQPNTFGVLWVPTTSAAQGYVQFYFNGNPVGSQVPLGGAGSAFNILDSSKLNLILGNSGQVPVTISNVQVWQNQATANDTGVNVAASASQPCVPTAAAQTMTAPNPTPAVTAAPEATAAASSEITPGQGSVTDCSGNVWSITASGSIQENGAYVAGGGGTSALSISGCTVYGQDNGKDGNTVNSGGWFTLSGSDWTPSAPPPGQVANTAAPATAPCPQANGAEYVSSGSDQAVQNTNCAAFAQAVQATGQTQALQAQQTSAQQ